MLNLDALNQILLVLAKWWMLSALTLMLVARSRNTSATTLHAILLFVLFALCCLPWLQSFVSVISIKMVPAHFAGIPVPDKVFAGFVLGYASVVFWLWLKLFGQLHHLRRLTKRAERPSIALHEQLVKELRQQLNMVRSVNLVCSHKVNTPLTFGWFAPTIILPVDSQYWDAGRLRRFLLHELAHIYRGDWLIKMVARMLVSVFWILPGAWTLLKKIEWYAELACDDAVICAEGTRADYADDLLEMTAIGHACNGAVALIENHGHYERIAAVLDGSRIRVSDSIKFWPYTTVFCGILVLLAGVRLAPTSVPSVSPYVLMPLVVATTELESVVQLPPMETPARPQKLPPENIPEVLRQPLLEVPLVENAVLEQEPLASGDFPVMTTAMHITTLLKPLHTPLPEYPKRALKKNIQGRVVAEFDVLPDGHVHAVTILASEPAGYFDQAVRAALKDYRYPPQHNVITGVTEVFEFKLLEDAQSIPAAKK